MYELTHVLTDDIECRLLTVFFQLFLKKKEREIFKTEIFLMKSIVHDYDKEHTVGVTGKQWMLTSLCHLPLLFVEVRVSSAPVLCFTFGLLGLDTVITKFPF